MATPLIFREEEKNSILLQMIVIIIKRNRIQGSVGTRIDGAMESRGGERERETDDNWKQ